MLQVIQFILNCVIQMAKMLFNINVGGSMSLGLLMCILFIFLPMLLRIVYFLRGDVVEELNNNYESTGSIFKRTPEKEYIGKHEPVGRHSPEYFRRQQQVRRYR